MILGPGVWWEKDNDTVVFRDDDKDLCFLGNRDQLYDTSAAVVSQMYSILLLKCGMNYEKLVLLYLSVTKTYAYSIPVGISLVTEVL